MQKLGNTPRPVAYFSLQLDSGQLAVWVAYKQWQPVPYEQRKPLSWP